MPYHFFATTLREPLREQSGRKRLLFKKLIKHECRVMVLFFQPTPLFTCKLEEVLVLLLDKTFLEDTLQQQFYLLLFLWLVQERKLIRQQKVESTFYFSTSRSSSTIGKLRLSMRCQRGERRRLANTSLCPISPRDRKSEVAFLRGGFLF